MAKSWRLSALALGALVAIGPALTACGAESASTQSANGPTVVRLASTATFNTVLVDLAIYGNLGEAHGVKIEKVSTTTADSAAQIAALIANSADMAGPGSNSVVDAIGAGADLKILASASPYQGNVTISNKALAKAGIDLDAPVEERLRALKGLSIAVGPDGSTGNAILRLILKGAGLNPDTDVKLVPLRDMSGVVAVGLQQGTYDAGFSTFGTAEPAVAAGDATVLASIPLGDFPILNDYVCCVLTATSAYVEKNPEAVKGVRAALDDAKDLIAKDPEKAAKIIKERTFPSLDQKLFDTAWNQVIAGFDDWDTAYTEKNFSTLVRMFGNEENKHYEGRTFEQVVAPMAGK